jgi:acetyl esterase/lipase
MPPPVWSPGLVVKFLAQLLLFTAAFSARGAGLPAADLTPGESEVRKLLPADEFEFTTLRLWPDKAPDEPRPLGPETVVEGKRSPMITSVTQPSITVARPKGPTQPLPAVIVCPGGGYGGLSVAEGGADIIRWLKDRGIAGVYMKYRVPKRHQGYEQHHHATQDIQRAICLLRSRAAEFNIDPQKIGAIGFSAGGHLAAMASANHLPELRLYQPIDDADKLSCRPDFVALIAPAYLTNPIPSADLDPALHPDQIQRNITPPTFIASACTDKFTIGASHWMLLLRDKHVPVECHIYEKGGHAEGIHDGPDNQWPIMFEDWLRRIGIIPKKN